MRAQVAKLELAAAVKMGEMEAARASGEKAVEAEAEEVTDDDLARDVRCSPAP